MMQADLLFSAEDAAKEVVRQGDAHVSFGKLKIRYVQLWSRCNELRQPDTEEEHVEHVVVRVACIKAFLLLVLDWTIFAGKNNRSVNLMWLLALQDFDELDN